MFRHQVELRAHWRKLKTFLKVKFYELIWLKNPKETFNIVF